MPAEYHQRTHPLKVVHDARNAVLRCEHHGPPKYQLRLGKAVGPPGQSDYL